MAPLGSSARPLPKQTQDSILRLLERAESPRRQSRFPEAFARTYGLGSKFSRDHDVSFRPYGPLGRNLSNRLGNL